MRDRLPNYSCYLRFYFLCACILSFCHRLTFTLIHIFHLLQYSIAFNKNEILQYYCVALYLAFQDHLLDLLDLFTLQVHLKRRVSLHLFRLPWLTSPIIIPSPRIRLAIRICILHPHLRGHVHLLCKTHIHQLASNIKFSKSPII